jgi:hypothetical protein
VKFANGPNRLISFKLSGKTYSFDPNRMFTPEGIKSTLQTYSSYTEVCMYMHKDGHLDFSVGKWRFASR